MVQLRVVTSGALEWKGKKEVEWRRQVKERKKEKKEENERGAQRHTDGSQGGAS
jgi:hypothetical protein